MELNKWKKGYIFGIIAMFIILAINPSINVIADPEYITVVTYRWDEATNEIVNQEEEWLIEDYNNFNDKFEVCNTFEDCFYVFQEFNFIPANQTISEFMDWSQNLYSENEEIVQENLSEFHVELPEQQNNFFNGFGVWMEGSVQGLMADLYMPVVFYLIYSENGGQVHYIADSPINGPSEATWEGDYWFSFWIGWIGLIVPPLTQFVTIWDITFTGICLYAEFTIV